jgi:hypothetical protein
MRRLLPILVFILTSVGMKAGNETTYTVAGTPTALFGQEWKEALAENDMTLNEGIYTWSKENVTLTAPVPKVEFKITQNHAWDYSYPIGYNNNYNLNYLIPGAGTYNFDIRFNAEKKNIEASVYNNVTITNAGYATFVASVNTNYTKAGLTAYAVTVNGETATLTPIDGIVAHGTGVILKGEAKTYKVYAYNTADPTVTVENNLQVSNGDVEGDGSTIYVLNKGTQGVGFYLLKAGNKLSAGKCYLKIESSNGAKSFIALDGSTTGISSLTTDATESNTLYNLAGQRVSKGYKGVIIRNGKKYINK